MVSPYTRQDSFLSKIGIKFSGYCGTDSRLGTRNCAHGILPQTGCISKAEIVWMNFPEIIFQKESLESITALNNVNSYF